MATPAIIAAWQALAAATRDLTIDRSTNSDRERGLLAQIDLLIAAMGKG